MFKATILSALLASAAAFAPTNFAGRCLDLVAALPVQESVNFNAESRIEPFPHIRRVG